MKKHQEIQERAIRFKNNKDYIVVFTSDWATTFSRERYDRMKHTFTKLILADIYEVKPYKNFFGTVKTKRVKVSHFSVKATCEPCSYEIVDSCLPKDNTGFYKTLNGRFWSLLRTLEISWIDKEIRGKLETELSIHHKAQNQQIHYAIDCGAATEHLEAIEDL